MGLDGVELVLAVEEEFGISIADEDAENLQRPRQLADYVSAKLNVKDNQGQRCLSQMAFYRLRAALVSQLGCSRQDIKPETELRTLFNHDVRRQWRLLGEAVGPGIFPSLKCKPRILWATRAIWLLGGLYTLWQAMSLSWLLIIALVLGAIAIWICTRWADQIPAQYREVKDLLPFVQLVSLEKLTPEVVLNRVIQIVATQTGISVDKISPDAHFINDLGIE